jgi:hypothetical protein
MPTRANKRAKVPPTIHQVLRTVSSVPCSRSAHGTVACRCCRAAGGDPDDGRMATALISLLS